MRALAPCLALAILALAACERREPPPPASREIDRSMLAHGRCERLARGVNIPHWLGITPNVRPERPIDAVRAHADAYFTERDAGLLRDAGFAHARLVIDPELLFDAGSDSVREDGWEIASRAIGLLLDAGLMVVFDPHPTTAPWNRPDREQGAGPSGGRRALIERFWAALAPRASTLDPERVLLEVMNEPADVRVPGLWNDVQARCVATIRSACPEHTIIVCGDFWSGIESLDRLAPPADANLIYTFHAYEPHTFTHQGAAWGAPHWVHLAGVPYPLGPDGLEPSDLQANIARARALAEGASDAGARGDLERYAGEAWGRRKIREHVARAGEWAHSRGLAIYCGEFGAYTRAPRRGRLAWIEDMRRALDERDIPWAMWDYSGGFALAPGEPGGRALDGEVSRALGRIEPGVEGRGGEMAPIGPR